MSFRKVKALKYIPFLHCTSTHTHTHTENVSRMNFHENKIFSLKQLEWTGRHEIGWWKKKRWRKRKLQNKHNRGQQNSHCTNAMNWNHINDAKGRKWQREWWRVMLLDALIIENNIATVKFSTFHVEESVSMDGIKMLRVLRL